ncbi:UNVERIFIED_CONTAM: hypothetical protein HDU68_005195 [Siphonaria sp. JEL0065]|nr:hypothetical protein HDU68_005195 [Siphonaria sp. JEL0065]
MLAHVLVASFLVATTVAQAVPATSDAKIFGVNIPASCVQIYEHGKTMQAVNCGQPEGSTDLRTCLCTPANVDIMNQISMDMPSCLPFINAVIDSRTLEDLERVAFKFANVCGVNLSGIPTPAPTTASVAQPTGTSPASDGQNGKSGAVEVAVSGIAALGALFLV